MSFLFQIFKNLNILSQIYQNYLQPKHPNIKLFKKQLHINKPIQKKFQFPLKQET